MEQSNDITERGSNVELEDTINLESDSLQGSPSVSSLIPIEETKSRNVQKADEAIMSELMNFFRASLTLGHIPDSWRKLKVVFISKVGMKDKTEPKASRPIRLTSTLHT